MVETDASDLEGFADLFNVSERVTKKRLYWGHEWGLGTRAAAREMTGQKSTRGVAALRVRALAPSLLTPAPGPRRWTYLSLGSACTTFAVAREQPFFFPKAHERPARNPPALAHSPLP